MDAARLAQALLAYQSISQRDSLVAELQEAKALSLKHKGKRQKAKPIREANKVLASLGAPALAYQEAADLFLASLDNAPCALYRHFASDGRLLYVGISVTLMSRIAGHRDNSAWFTDIVRIELQWFDTRSAALEAERLAIQTEKPIHNVVYNANPPER